MEVLAHEGRPITKFDITNYINDEFKYNEREIISTRINQNSIRKAIDGKRGLGNLGLIKIYNYEDYKTGDLRIEYILSVIGLLVYLSRIKIENINSFIKNYSKYYDYPILKFWDFIESEPILKKCTSLSDSARDTIIYYPERGTVEKLRFIGLLEDYKTIKFLIEYDAWEEEEEPINEKIYSDEEAVLDYFTFNFFERIKNNIILNDTVKEIFYNVANSKYKKIKSELDELEKLSNIYYNVEFKGGVPQ